MNSSTLNSHSNRWKREGKNSRAILPKDDVRIENLVLVQDVLHHLLIAVSEDRRSRELDATSGLPLEVDARTATIQPNAHFFQLPFEEFPLQGEQMNK